MVGAGRESPRGLCRRGARSRSRTARHSARARIAAGALALMVAGSQVGAAERQDPYAVQAAMLVNVVKFVTWPGGARPERQRICALGATRFAAALAQLARGGAPLEVVELRSAARAERCSVALLGAAGDEELEELAEQLAGAGALTVSDQPGAARRGVFVNFVLEGDRVRFEVNLAAARRAGFEISSKLLRLARVVEGSPP